MSTTVMFIGLAVFLAHFLALQFRHTNIPDVLVLVVLGIVIGPLTGVVSADDFGKIGPIIATIALVVILFEGGTALDLKTLTTSLGSTGALTISTFSLTVGVVTGVGLVVFGLGLLPALLLGVTLGGTSSAVVIPMVNSLRMGEKPATVLVLESALTDVLCIVGVFALLQVHAQGQLNAGHLVGSVMAAMIFAAVIGLAGGVGWLLVLERIRDFPNSISSTLAYVFIVYGVTEFLGYSGAIAALSLGITLGNSQRLGLKKWLKLQQDVDPLSPEDLNFYREAVFLLKTYFFIYLGVSIHFGNWTTVMAAVLMMALVYLARWLVVRRLYRSPSVDLRDAAITVAMVPKGLAAAVLASLPLQQGVPGGEVIRDVSYMVVLVSIALTALMVICLPWPSVNRLYAQALGKQPATAVSEPPVEHG